jgi:hypothetical protein
MKFLFEPNLSHQREAVSAVVGLFEGAAYTRPEEKFWGGEVSSNVLKLPESAWYENAAKNRGGECRFRTGSLSGA